jgi:tetratricopeptide (TPR) repeat protein
MEVNEKMAMLLFQTEKFEESLPYFEKFYTLGGEKKDTLYSYGKALTSTEKYDLAEEVFLSVIQREPEVYQITVVQALVDLYIMQDKLNEAKQFVTTLIKSGYEVPAHLQEQKAHIRDLMKKKS